MMKKVVHVFTVSMSVLFLEGLSKQLEESGYELVVISADGIESRRGEQAGDFSFYPVEMARGINPIQNLKCWFKVRKILKVIKPDIVHGNTPIGGLIAMSTALSLGIKGRFYTLHGLKYPSEMGLKRLIVKTLEKATIFFASRAFAVSSGLKDFATSENLASASKLNVLNHGSVKGIDVDETGRVYSNGKTYYEKQLGLTESKFRIGYFGRINEDKGIPELIEALDKLRSVGYVFATLFCGIEEFVHEKEKMQFSNFVNTENAIFQGFVTNPVEYMRTCDIVVLPTHREGFGLVNIEANSVGVPVVTTDVMGCKDSIEEGETGLFCKVYDPEDLYQKISYMLDNPDELKRMGERGRERAIKLFNRQDIWLQLINEYDKAIGE